MDDYVAEITALKEEFKDRIEILCGLETDYVTGVTMPFAETKKKYHLDYRKVLSIEGVAEHVLHLAVDAKNPERLHQQVEKQQEDDILDEAVLHCFDGGLSRKSRKKSISSVFRTPFWKLSVFLHPNFPLLWDEEIAINEQGTGKR